MITISFNHLSFSDLLQSKANNTLLQPSGRLPTLFGILIICFTLTITC